MSTDSHTNQYYLLASYVVFYYDFILTIPQEVKYIWARVFRARKLDLVDCLILALRYISVISFSVILALAFTPASWGSAPLSKWLVFLIHNISRERILSRLRSLRVYRFPGILSLVTQSIISAFLIIRLYAISDKRRWILGVTSLVALLNIVMSSLALLHTLPYFTETFSPAMSLITSNGDSDSGQQVQTLSCLMYPGPDGESRFVWESSFITMLLFDTMVCIISVWRLAYTYSSERRTTSSLSLASILLRDGVMLYFMLTISNIFNLVAYLRIIKPVANPNDVGSAHALGIFIQYLFVVSTGTNSEMTHALVVALISRMIFNLREAGTEVYEGTEEWRGRIERTTRNMNFRTVTDASTEAHELEMIEDFLGGLEGGAQSGF